MSLEAMVWALTKAPIADPVARLVLVGLGNHADPEGRGARPAQATLARYVGVSTRTVRTKLRLLEDLRLIREGDQRAVEHLRADRRPVVLDLALEVVAERPESTSARSTTGSTAHHGRKMTTARAEDDDRTTGNTLPTEPSMNLSTEPSVNTCTIRGEIVGGSGHGDTDIVEGVFDDVDWFEAFWAAYPRRVGKAKALLAFERAAVRSDPAAIVDGARAVAADPNLPPVQFVPHPTTWLNRDGWTDEPFPSRGGGSWIADEMNRAARFSAGGER